MTTSLRSRWFRNLALASIFAFQFASMVLNTAALVLKSGTVHQYVAAVMNGIVLLNEIVFLAVHLCRFVLTEERRRSILVFGISCGLSSGLVILLFLRLCITTNGKNLYTDYDKIGGEFTAAFIILMAMLSFCFAFGGLAVSLLRSPYSYVQEDGTRIILNKEQWYQLQELKKRSKRDQNSAYREGWSTVDLNS